MSDSEDRTQAPSKLRRQQARERGQVAHSPELTAAAALLAVAGILTLCGPSLVAALVELVRQPLLGTPGLSISPDDIADQLRRQAFAIAAPLTLVLSTSWLAAFVAHQGQVQGLWAPAMLAPDIGRLWTFGQGKGFAAGAGRGVWSLIKAVVVTVVAALMIRSQWPAFQRLAQVDNPELTLAAGLALRNLTLALSAAMIGLGLLDFTFASQRFETMLKLSPEEHREELRAAEGDPSLRARRRRLAQAWRVDSPEALAGASLVLNGSLGLTVVLMGGPAPRPVSIRLVVAGSPGDRVRRTTTRMGIPQVQAPILARKLSRRRPIGTPLPLEILAELKSCWPEKSEPIRVSE